MIEVRPTIEVLKDLERKKLLPLDTVRALQHARQVDDSETRLVLLAKLGLSSLDIPLLRNARSEFATGKPDRQTTMTALAKVLVSSKGKPRLALWARLCLTSGSGS